MRVKVILSAVSSVTVLAVTLVAQQAGQTPAQGQATPEIDDMRTLVTRLELEKYKATLKGLTQFGDRRRAPNGIVTPSIGSKRSSRATAARTERIIYT